MCNQRHSWSLQQRKESFERYVSHRELNKIINAFSSARQATPEPVGLFLAMMENVFKKTIRCKNGMQVDTLAASLILSGS